MAEHLTGLYPGTFDPITRGHLDIIDRALRLVDVMVIAVAANLEKAPLFSIGERTEMVRNETESLAKAAGKKVEVISFENLLTDCARDAGAGIIIRGLRAVADFEYEFQMVGMNRRLNPDIETVFLMASDKFSFIASRLVKEVAKLGGDIDDFVTPGVADQLKRKLAAAK